MSRFTKHRADIAALFKLKARLDADVAAGKPISEDARFWLQHAPALLDRYTPNGYRKPTPTGATRGRKGKE